MKGTGIFRTRTDELLKKIQRLNAPTECAKKTYRAMSFNMFNERIKVKQSRVSWRVEIDSFGIKYPLAATAATQFSKSINDSSNLDPRVLKHFCQRLVARRDQPLTKTREDSGIEIVTIQRVINVLE